MTRFIETARRVGSLDIVPNVLEKAEKFSPRTILDSGYHYCKGLYEWYTGIKLFLITSK
jgi:tetratricopeptide repeat protein 21B